MVAGAVKVCKWKYRNAVIRVSSGKIKQWICQKTEFSRGAMEKSLGLTFAQSEWWIKELRHKGMIKRTKRYEYKQGKGQRQVIYKVIHKYIYPR